MIKTNLFIFVFIILNISCGTRKVICLTSLDYGNIHRLKLEYHHKLRDTIGYEIIEFNSAGIVQKNYGNLKTDDMNWNFIGYYIHKQNRIQHVFYVFDDNVNSFDSLKGDVLYKQDFVFKNNKYQYTINYRFNSNYMTYQLDTFYRSAQFQQYNNFNKLYRKKYHCNE